MSATPDVPLWSEVEREAAKAFHAAKKPDDDRAWLDLPAGEKLDYLSPARERLTKALAEQRSSA